MKKINLLLVGVIIFLLIGCMSVEDKLAQNSSDNSLLNVRERGTLFVGTNIPYEPMEFLDANGEFVGIDIDVARNIASEMGLEIEFVNYEWDDLFVAIKNGEVDFAISSITITPERSEEMLFSIPYFNAGQVIIVNDDNQEIVVPEDLFEKKVGVQLETTSYDEAVKYAGEEYVFLYVDYDRPVVDLLNKELDAIITSDEAHKHKPNPELFLKAAESLEIQPSEAIVFEDAVNGIEAAKRAKMKVVGVVTHFHTRDDLKDADLIVNELSEINIVILENLL
jgi:glutamine transport system substrate-binding protein